MITASVDKTVRHASSDAGYHARHARRSLRRARCLAAHMEPGGTVLDVGCNQGLTSGYLLDSGVARHVTGVELHASTVPSALKARADFDLVEGDIARLQLQGGYDYCVYGAVHHHVTHLHGLAASVAVLHSLAARSRRSLFIETGHISEGGRWGWQRTLRTYFRTDEEHIHYLLACIEHRVESFEVIGRFPMHGVRRAYLRVDLKSASADVGEPDPHEAEARTESRRSWSGRSFGSRGQVVAPAESECVSDSPTFFGTCTEEGTDRFVKRHVHRPLAARIEWLIGQQAVPSWAVRPLSIATDGRTLTFPQVRDATTLPKAELDREDRGAVADRLVEIFAEAGRTRIDLPTRVLMPAEPHSSLLDLCDLNPNNVLLAEGENEQEVLIVDFEQHGARCRSRNRINLARMLWRLRERRVFAGREFVAGCLGTLWLMAGDQRASLECRIRAGRPGLLSLLVAELRSRTGILSRAVVSSVVAMRRGESS